MNWGSRGGGLFARDQQIHLTLTSAEVTVELDLQT